MEDFNPDEELAEPKEEEESDLVGHEKFKLIST